MFHHHASPTGHRRNGFEEADTGLGYALHELNNGGPIPYLAPGYTSSSPHVSQAFDPRLLVHSSANFEYDWYTNNIQNDIVDQTRLSVQQAFGGDFASGEPSSSGSYEWGLSASGPNTGTEAPGPEGVVRAFSLACRPVAVSTTLVSSIPSFSPTSSIITTAHHRQQTSMSPTLNVQFVRCLLQSQAGEAVPTPCSGSFHLSRREKGGLAEHLRLFHNTLSTPTPGKHITCTWPGCACAPQARPRKGCDKTRAHPAHVEDLAEHIRKAHMGLRYVCRICRRADWTTSHNFNKHNCKGQVEVRCTGCFDVFPSEFALVDHSDECPALAS